MNTFGSDRKTETVLGVSVSYSRRWERETKRVITREDGTAIGVINRALTTSGDRYTYNGHKTFPLALESVVRGVL